MTPPAAERFKSVQRITLNVIGIVLIHTITMVLILIAPEDHGLIKNVLKMPNVIATKDSKENLSPRARYGNGESLMIALGTVAPHVSITV